MCSEFDSKARLRIRTNGARGGSLLIDEIDGLNGRPTIAGADRSLAAPAFLGPPDPVLGFSLCNDRVVIVENVVRGPVPDHRSMIEQHRTVAERLDGRRVVRYQEHRRALVPETPDPRCALVLKIRVPDR